jgi:type I restriction enzyme S subunit
LKTGDTVLSIVGTIGKVAQAPIELDGGNITQSSCRIRHDDSLLSGPYLRAFLRSPGAIEQFDDKRLGTAVPRLNIADIRQFSIPLPPLAEQRRIVDKLNALNACLARARLELDRVSALADRLREAVLKRVFAHEFRVNQLSETDGACDASDAELVQLAEFNPKHSKTLDRNQIVSFVPMASVSDVAGKILSHMPRPLSEVWTGYTHFADGDVIFAKITPCMENGKAAVVRDLHGGLGCGSTEFYVMRPGPGLMAKLLWYCLRSISLRRVAETKMSGAVGQRRVPRQFLEGLRIKNRSLAEQDAALVELDAAFARADRLEAEAARARALLDRLESALLAKAFRGELVPQDPNDEPAHVLLDRIRSARELGRAAAPKAKRGRKAKVAA